MNVWWVQETILIHTERLQMTEADRKQNKSIW